MFVAKGPLATSRRGRNVTTKRTWQDKIDPECLKYLEMYRQAAENAAGPHREFGDLLQWLQQYKHNLELFPTPPESGESETTVVTLDGKFVDLLRSSAGYATLKEGENRLPLGHAKMLEVAQPIALLLEEPKMRVGACLGLGLLYLLAEPVVSGLRVEQFGTEPLDPTKIRALAAMMMEFLAKFVRGRWEPPKGRNNQELIAIVNVIKNHQIVRLTAQELREAVMLAGISVPDGETWRMWLHRAKKRGLVSDPTVPTKILTEVEIPINPDGSLDLNSLDPETRRLALKALTRWFNSDSVK
jgi:hypothetical protein